MAILTIKLKKEKKKLTPWTCFKLFCKHKEEIYFSFGIISLIVCGIFSWVNTKKIEIEPKTDPTVEVAIKQIANDDYQEEKNLRNKYGKIWTEKEVEEEFTITGFGAWPPPGTNFKSEFGKSRVEVIKNGRRGYLHHGGPEDKSNKFYWNFTY